MEEDKFIHFPLKNPFICAGSLLFKNNKIILLRNNKNNEIVLPKGHVEEGDDLAKTAVKETYEETGYRCEIKEGPFCMTVREKKNSQKIIFLYVTHAISEHELNTQAAGEDFTSLEYDLSQAKDALTFKADKMVIENYLNNFSK